MKFNLTVNLVNSVGGSGWYEGTGWFWGNSVVPEGALENYWVLGLLGRTGGTWGYWEVLGGTVGSWGVK